MTNQYISKKTNRLYLFLLLCFISITQSSCLFSIYSPSSTLSMTGTTSYCQNATATSNTLTYNQCTLGGGLLGDDGVAYTAQWYVNTTGGTSIPASTPHGGPISAVSPAGGSGTVSYVPTTTTPGTYYYFCYITWGTTGTCTPDFTSSAQMVTINAGPAALTGTATLCGGTTTTLASTTSGGTWSSSAPGVATVAGGVVTGVSPGTATIIYTVGSCTATRVVTVNAAPGAITPTTPVTICQGTTTALSNAAGAGTWSSSNPAVGTVSSTGVVSAIAGGTTNITFTLSSTGCFTVKPITVNPVPAPITGPSQVCIGTNIALTSITPGGAWSSSTPATATVNPTTGTVTGIAAGTTTITYSGCGYVVKEITVNPLPAAITGTLTVCETSGTTTLSSATAGGTWSSAAPGTATATTLGANDGQITGVSDGTVTITYTSALSCITTAEVTVNPAPDAITGAIPICAGQSMSLFNAIPGGSWSSSAPAIAIVSPTGVVTGISGGVAVILYSNECGTSSINATINPLPAAIEGNDTVCVGSTIALADETIGGTWSSSFPAIASVLTTSGLISGHVPGTTIITYTMPGGCYTTLPVHVVLPPDVITGTMTACPGTSTTLSNVVSGGMWQSGSPSIATVSATSGVVTGVSAGLADITYTTGPSCAVYANVLINPLPEPIIGADTIYCAADKDTLYNATPGGVWSSLTPGIATVDAGDGIMTILNGGVAIIRYTLPTGCYVSKSVSVNAAPMATVTYNPATNTLYTETTWGSYQWYNGIQGAIPGATTYRTAALYYTDYWVRVNDENACFGSSAHYNYNSASGTTDPAMNRDNYFVFPNPSNLSITIEAPIDVRAVITSADGKALITRNHAKTIDISKLADGMYMVLLYDQNGVQRAVHKLIKQ